MQTQFVNNRPPDTYEQVALSEQEKKNAGLNLQLSRLRVEHDRAQEQLRIVLEEEMAPLLKEKER
jgi:uncharacterized coiled-coil protein SlyX